MLIDGPPAGAVVTAADAGGRHQSAGFCIAQARPLMLFGSPRRAGGTVSTPPPLTVSACAGPRPAHPRPDLDADTGDTSIAPAGQEHKAVRPWSTVTPQYGRCRAALLPQGLAVRPPAVTDQRPHSIFRPSPVR